MKGNKTFEKEHFKINVSRIKKEGQNFEINIDPDLAIAYKEGKEIDIKDILKSENIFFDAKEGELASEELMNTVFGTSEPLEVAKKIIDNGEIQLTAEHRGKVREQKKKKLIQMIHRNAIDPKTGSPHPIQRIENAMEEAKIKIKEIDSIEDQVNDIIKKLQPIIPIKFDKKKIEIKISAQYAHTIYATVKKYGTIQQNQWLNDGSWYGVVQIPAGLQNELFDELNKATHGGVVTKILD